MPIPRRYRETALPEYGAGNRRPLRLSSPLKILIAFVTLSLCVTSAAAQIARATVTVEGPIFIRPGAETALKVLAVGTELKVLQEETGWAQVEFNDLQFGRRVGWVEARLIRTAVDDAVRRGAPRVEARVVADRPLPSPPASPGTAAITSVQGGAPGKLTELFKEAKIKYPHINAERVVQDIDDAVRKVRTPDWQSSPEDVRVVQESLRKTLLKYQLQSDQQLFDRTLAFVRQYY